MASRHSPLTTKLVADGLSPRPSRKPRMSRNVLLAILFSAVAAVFVVAALLGPTPKPPTNVCEIDCQEAGR
jgi:hypothetical protein